MSGRHYTRQRTSPPIGGETPHSEASSPSQFIDSVHSDDDQDVEMGDDNIDRDGEGTQDPDRMEGVEELENNNPEAQDLPMPRATQRLKPLNRLNRKTPTIILDNPSSPGQNTILSLPAFCSFVP